MAAEGEIGKWRLILDENDARKSFYYIPHIIPSLILRAAVTTTTDTPTQRMKFPSVFELVSTLDSDVEVCAFTTIKHHLMY